MVPANVGVNEFVPAPKLNPPTFGVFPFSIQVAWVISVAVWIQVITNLNSSPKLMVISLGENENPDWVIVTFSAFDLRIDNKNKNDIKEIIHKIIYPITMYFI